VVAVTAVAALLVATVVWLAVRTSGHGDSATAGGGSAPTSVSGVVPRDSSTVTAGNGAATSDGTATSVASAPGSTAVVTDRRAGGDTTTTTSPPSLSLSPLGDGWVTLASLQSGDGDRSPVFHLRQRDTRLRYRSNATSLTVYVVDAVKGTDATAGFADAECSGACDESYMALDVPPGDYYLMVRGDGGSWVVDISERS